MRTTVRMPYPEGAAFAQGKQVWRTAAIEIEIREVDGAGAPPVANLVDLRLPEPYQYRGCVRSDDGGRFLWPVVDPATGLALTPQTAFRTSNPPDQMYDRLTLGLRGTVPFGMSFPRDLNSDIPARCEGFDLARRVLADNCAKLLIVDGDLYREGPEPVLVIRRDDHRVELSVERFSPFGEEQRGPLEAGDVYRLDEYDEAMSALGRDGGQVRFVGVANERGLAMISGDVLHRRFRRLGEDLLHLTRKSDIQNAAATFAMWQILELEEALEIDTRRETSYRFAAPLRALVEKLRGIDLLKPEGPRDYQCLELEALLDMAERAFKRFDAMAIPEPVPESAPVPGM